MKTKYLFLQIFVLFVGALTLLAAKPSDFSDPQIDGIWKELWKSGDPGIKEPKIEKLTEKVVVKQMSGQWTVMFGAIPDKLMLSLNTNHLVTVSGKNHQGDWKRTGEWRVISGKLVLFMEKDSLPSFIFRTQSNDYIFDPWSKTMMSELKHEK